MKKVAIVSVVAVIAMFFYLVAESKVLSYMSSEPEVCITCHTMNTHYATWQHSSHREKATCVDCHLPRGSMAKKLLAKTRDGYNHSMAMTFETYGYNLRTSKHAAARIQANCISCHEEIVSQMLANAALYSKVDSHVQMGRNCWDCHREVPHGLNRNLTATQANLISN
jgi:cytochrome c nitrite reductase small subunit